MRFLAVHPGCLMYSKIYLRLEPLGVELVCAAARQAGHEVRLIDLQADQWADYFKIMDRWQPDAIAFSCNYLANVPEILDLAGMRIGELIAKKGIRKKYYLETRGHILLRNKEVFKFWRELGLEYMFLGIEAIDEEGLKRFRKRVSLSQNFEALEFARSLDVSVAINIIADPSWTRDRFKVIREWCMEIPEIVNISVNTPYPGTESLADGITKIDNMRLPAVRHSTCGAAD